MFSSRYSSKAENKVEDTYIKQEYQDYVKKICDEYCICPELVTAIIEAESSGIPTAKNGNCKGLMQVNNNCHKDRMKRLGVTDIYDPYGNILVGVDYLSDLFVDYEDVALVLMIYNGSSKAIQIYESGKMTRYAEKILNRSAELEELHY